MGKVTSKLVNTPSFDHIKSVKKSIDGRRKNIPICLSNKPQQAEKAESLSNEKLPRFVENIILIWLDNSLERQTESNQKSVNQFLRVTNIVETFSDLEKCFHFINSIKNEQIFFIVSGSLGSQILPRIENFNQINSIHIFCGNRKNHEEWIKQYRKIKGIHTNIKELCNEIRHDIYEYDKSLTSISILPSSPITNINESNKEFIYLQILKSIILESQYDKKFGEDFLYYTRQFYLNNEQQFNIIDTFEENYHLHSPIWWYTRKCFLYQMLRKAFHFNDFEIIYKLAFFIRDLHRDIKKSYLQTHNHQYHPITVYRATSMKNNEYENIERNLGGFLAFNDFLLTTLERSIALKLAHNLRNDQNLISIIYKIDIDPATSTIPYIALNNLSYLSNTNGEVLFSMNTIFRIDEIEKISERTYEINLTPATKKDEQIKFLIEYMQEKTSGLSSWYKLSKIMMDINEYDEVENIYKYIYDQVHEHHREERAFIQHELGYIYDLKNNLSMSINHYKQAIEIYFKYLPSNHPTLLSTYINFASVLQKQGDLNGALEQYQYALKIKISNDPNIIIQYNNIGIILQQQGKYSEAQQTYEKAVQILLQDFPFAYSLLADTYHNIAGLFYLMKDYLKALSYYEKTLEMEKKASLLNHPSSASTYFNIATTYEGLNDNQNAIKYAEKAVEVARLAFGNEHLETKENINYLEQLQQKPLITKL